MTPGHEKPNCVSILRKKTLSKSCEIAARLDKIIDSLVHVHTLLLNISTEKLIRNDHLFALVDLHIDLK